MNVNGRGDSSPEPFELSALVEGLAAPSPRKCRTPESFLDPNAASLVNLESLIPSNPSSKTTNPFLAGNSQIYRMQNEFFFDDCHEEIQQFQFSGILHFNFFEKNVFFCSTTR